jgi:predicted GNAT family N-acyltransferase
MPDPTGHRYGRRPVTIHDSTFADLRPETLYEILRLRIDVFVVEQDCAVGFVVDGDEFLEDDIAHVSMRRKP